ncbi:MAG: response regulator transcription factor [Phycisphaerae bacterium]
MNAEPTVFVVDDDEALRRSLRRLLESVGRRVETFPSAQAFLEQHDPSRPGCLILDIKMPGMSGLELQEELARIGDCVPVIIVSGHGDVASAVQAMKTGAVDFLRKPHRARVLLERIRHALRLDAERRSLSAQRAAAAARLKSLTPRERQVMAHLVDGKATKRIAYELGLARKTVDVHRGNLMRKLAAESVVDLVRIWPG